MTKCSSSYLHVFSGYVDQTFFAFQKEKEIVIYPKIVRLLRIDMEKVKNDVGKYP